jgi:DNA repair protein RadC
MSPTDVNHRISDLPLADRPRERLRQHGPIPLSDSELLAILLRVGGKSGNAVEVSRRLLENVGGLHGLRTKSLEELTGLQEMGVAKSSVLVAAIELGRRIASTKLADSNPLLSSPESVAELIMYEMSALDQEYLKTILVDTRNRLIKIITVYHGSLNASIVRVGEVFRDAIRCNAAGIIVTHNHPSGDPSPSAEDIRITSALVEAGQLLDMPVLDHIIIGRGSYISLREKGLGFSRTASG